MDFMTNFCVKRPHTPPVKNINRRLAYFYICRALHAARTPGVASSIDYSGSVALPHTFCICYMFSVASLQLLNMCLSLLTHIFAHLTFHELLDLNTGGPDSEL